MRYSLLLLAALACSCSQPNARQDLLASTALILKEGFAAGPAPLRYNPVDCECPPFEARTGER